MRAVLLIALLVPGVATAVSGSGKHWRVSVEAAECREGIVTIGMRVRYLGPPGAVEAPVVRMAGANGAGMLPKSVAWKQGAKPLAAWLAAGGLRNIKPEELGEVEAKFDAGGASFEFGDVPPFTLDTKKCRFTAHAPRAGGKGTATLVVHRARYPCTPSRTVAADYPPYLPKQIVVLGRGYLPNARDVELPMGRAPAQSYAYSGPDELKPVEDAAQKAIAADFPQYDRARHFAFNWGIQRSATGNEAYSVGIYELRPCPN